MDSFKNQFQTRPTALASLAIVGFTALVALGIWLAIYSTRFVPPVVDRLSAAAVYLGQVFTPHKASLSVVPTASSTVISFGDATSTAATAASASTEPKPTSLIAGPETTAVYPVNTNTVAPIPNGLPDLRTSIIKVGYLATSSASSFIASSTVPANSRPAVRFTIKNVGGSSSGAWRFSASIPTAVAFVYQSQLQQSLAPGDSIDYTLGFDQALRGADKAITITANFDHAFAESTLSNNTASTTVTILGS